MSTTDDSGIAPCVSRCIMETVASEFDQNITSFRLLVERSFRFFVRYSHMPLIKPGNPTATIGRWIWERFSELSKHDQLYVGDENHREQVVNELGAKKESDSEKDMRLKEYSIISALHVAVNQFPYHLSEAIAQEMHELGSKLSVFFSLRFFHPIAKEILSRFWESGTFHRQPNDDDVLVALKREMIDASQGWLLYLPFERELTETIRDVRANGIIVLEDVDLDRKLLLSSDEAVELLKRWPTLVVFSDQHLPPSVFRRSDREWPSEEMIYLAFLLDLKERVLLESGEDVVLEDRVLEAINSQGIETIEFLQTPLHIRTRLTSEWSPDAESQDVLRNVPEWVQLCCDHGLARWDNKYGKRVWQDTYTKLRYILEQWPFVKKPKEFEKYFPLIDRGKLGVVELEAFRVIKADPAKNGLPYELDRKLWELKKRIDKKPPAAEKT